MAALRLRTDRPSALRERPELCGLPVVSVIREPDRDVAIDIVFVGDGYTTSNLGAFRSTVENWIREMDADTDGVVGRDRTLFNFHRVGLTPLASEAHLTCTDENGDSSEVTLRLHD